MNDNKTALLTEGCFIIQICFTAVSRAASAAIIRKHNINIESIFWGYPYICKKMLSKKDIVAEGPFLNYINKAAAADVAKSIRKSTKAFQKLLKNIPAKKRNHAYAEGKWTIKESLQHIIDAERVFAYRALRVARLDATPLPGFDENSWAIAANKIDRKWDDLVKEFKTVRASTEILFQSLGEAELIFAGTASNLPINALALGYVIAGHLQHHIEIIEQRYLAKKIK